MDDPKCPICHGKCIVKRISEDDPRFKEVDVCSACGVVHERGADDPKKAADH